MREWPGAERNIDDAGASYECSGTDTETLSKTPQLTACQDAAGATALPPKTEEAELAAGEALASSSAPGPVAVTATVTATAAAAAAAAPEEGRTKLQTTIILLSLCSAVFLAALDVTIVTVAIPTIAGEFDSTVGYTWIGSAYLLANAAAAPSWGKISDIWGRKQVLLVAVAIFWVGSLVGGGVIVLVNVCISDLFSLRKRGLYFGIVGLVWALSGGIGPIIGGALTSHASWRWCFYVNLPISGVGFVLLVLVLKLHNPRTRLRDGLAAVDWAGSLAIIGGTLMILLGLTFGDVVYPWRSAAVGVGLNFQSPLIALQSTVQQQKDISSATATFGFTRQLATAISVVIGGVLFQNGMQRQHLSLVAGIGEQAADLLTGSSAASSVYLIQDLDSASLAAARQAYWNSLRTMYIMFAALAAVGLFVSFLVQQTTLSSVHEEQKTGLQNMEQVHEKKRRAETAHKNGDVEQGIAKSAE